MRSAVARIVTVGSAAAAVGLAALAVNAYGRAEEVRETMLSGEEAMAAVVGGAAGLRARMDGGFALDIEWADRSGARREAQGLAIGQALGKQVIAGAAGDPPRLMIKYLPAPPQAEPVVVLEAAQIQEANRVRFALGTIGAVVSVLVAMAAAWLGWRRS